MKLLGSRTPKHQQFKYKPRFWDPEKEELEARRARREKLQQEGIEGAKERIRSGFVTGRGGAASGRYRSQQVRRSNFTFLIVVAALVVLAVLLLVVYLPRFEAWLSGAG